MKYSTKDDRHRGNYKTSSNNVEAFGPNGESLGIIFRTANPLDTPFKMTELVAWTNESLENTEIHPLLVIAVFVAVFLAIHPFQDGNGRLSRILTTLLLLKMSYSYVRFSSMESIVESGKEAYYLALRRTQATLESDTPVWDPWMHFFLESMQRQKLNLQTKLSRERIIDGDLPALSAQILSLLREHTHLKISDIEKLTGESRSTIKLRLNSLIQRAMLVRHGKGPGTWYALPREFK